MKRITLQSVLATIAIICFFVIILTGEDCDVCFSRPVMMIKFFVCGLIILTGSIYLTKKFTDTEKLIFTIEAQPTLDIHEATDGVPFAGYGKIEPFEGKVLKSPLTKTDCVYYHSIKEQFVTIEGRNKWIIIFNIASFIPFYLADKTGRIRVDLTNLDNDFSGYKLPLARLIPDPKNSEIDTLKAMRMENTENGATFRLTEYILIPGMRVFAYGMVSKHKDGLFLHEDNNHPLIISTKTRGKFVDEFYKGGNLTYLVHFLTSLGFTVMFSSANYFFNLNPFVFYNILLAGNSLIAGSSIFAVFNRLVTLKQRAVNARSNIEIELKRRADLIPQIIEVVRKYSQHEKEIQEILNEARSETGEIASLRSVIENYPQLKASENFQLLMRTLVDTEERIVYCREFYNRNVRKFNIMINQFPFSIIALLAGFKEMEFFDD